jgi:hypothetical protein
MHRIARVAGWAFLAATMAIVILISCPSAGTASSTATSSSASVVLSPASGTSGTQVTITGSGFPPGEIVALYIDVAGPYLGFPGPVADAQGAFVQTVRWPAKNYDATHRVDPSSAGSHAVCGDTGYPGNRQNDAVRACAQFVVEAGALATPTPISAPSPWGSQTVFLIGFVILATLAVAAIISVRRAAQK